MTKVEYENALAAAKIAYDRECNKIKTRYARENNPVKIGDIVANKEYSVIIKVEDFSVYCSFGKPECRYYGTRLKKDGNTPYKNQNENIIFQSSVAFINKQPYKFNPN